MGYLYPLWLYTPLGYLSRHKKKDAHASFCMVRLTGIEPAQIAPQEPKSCASANSATAADPGLYGSHLCEFLQPFAVQAKKDEAGLLCSELLIEA